MTAIRTMLRMLRADERGATAIEYGLIAALISVACISGFSAMGGGSNGMWGGIGNKVEKAMNK
ncbi:Flp family type IVb pilin [Sphingomonas sp. LHG3406-1]|uniref:Flp family type IVb pilin n=1 Tax=Sphingomonas sp. LHG3406-1 TaxID=2804617 RepID=UPI002608B2B1|nr:Flp family type IVb pilin [Sphingomonas sp. LHG3406-1]